MSHVDKLLPNGDYFVVRKQLRSGRVMVVYLPVDLSADEQDDVLGEFDEIESTCCVSFSDEAPDPSKVN